jgi:cell shape-determining protein MreC
MQSFTDLLEQIERLETENEQLIDENEALIELCNYYRNQYERTVVYVK